MREMLQTDDSTPSQNHSAPQVTTPENIKDSLHTLIWNQLPTYLQQAAEQNGVQFGDCRIEYYRDYRVLIITPEGLGVDMDHRQNDVNFFQAESLDIAYSEEEVEYISRRKAAQYESYSKVSLFRAIWTDTVEQLGSLKPGPGILQP